MGSSKRIGIVLDAIEWLIKSGRAPDAPPKWDVEADGMPHIADGDLVYDIAIPMWVLKTSTVPLRQAEAMQRRYDPKGVGPWAFLPAPRNSAAIWLIHVAGVAPMRN